MRGCAGFAEARFGESAPAIYLSTFTSPSQLIAAARLGPESELELRRVDVQTLREPVKHALLVLADLVVGVGRRDVQRNQIDVLGHLRPGRKLANAIERAGEFLLARSRGAVIERAVEGALDLVARIERRKLGMTSQDLDRLRAFRVLQRTVGVGDQRTRRADRVQEVRRLAVLLVQLLRAPSESLFQGRDDAQMFSPWFWRG